MSKEYSRRPKPVRYTSVPEVTLITQAGTDEDVVRAARVSVKGGSDEGLVKLGTVGGLINHMMVNRHGSVFEHNVFTFRINTPIFVAREFMRHRHFSFNEESARYKELEPVFWVPSRARKLRQEGKPSAYRMLEGNQNDYLVAHDSMTAVYEMAQREYRLMLDHGIAREVARAVLPVGVYTTFYATTNARSLMNFLALRIDHPKARVPSHPLAEIQQVALVMEDHFACKMPVTHKAWHDNGRVAP